MADELQKRNEKVKELMEFKEKLNVQGRKLEEKK